MKKITGILPKEFKEKWVAALRSGEFYQIKGALVNEDGYCCLGVACSIQKYQDRYISKHQTIPDHYTRVPIALRGDNKDNDLVDKLTTMNDINGPCARSFNHIANFIEKYL